MQLARRTEAAGDGKCPCGIGRTQPIGSRYPLLSRAVWGVTGPNIEIDAREGRA